MKLKRHDTFNEENTYSSRTEEPDHKDDMPTKGLLVNVYRNAKGDDASAEGLTSKVTSVVIVGPGIPEIFSANDKSPAVYLDKIRDHIFASPVDKTKELSGIWMFGGNFIYSTDSRFSKLTADGNPIPVHDRFESWKTFDALSK